MTSCLPAIYSMASPSAVLLGTSEWHCIRWDRVIRQVRSIQSRIVKAVQATRWNKVKVLQGILTRSYAARLLAIRRVTENRGSKTAGIDEQLWNTPELKLQAVSLLEQSNYQPLAVRRVKISKGKGKWRPLGIPAMKDRAMQALHLLGLDPISETLADWNSYGFRPSRSCADAIQKCFQVLCKKTSAQWVLEGDIKGCFDNISHQWLLNNIPMDRKILAKWLKAGVVVNKQLFPTYKGSPQGSVISPVLANMVLDGMETVVNKVADVNGLGNLKFKRYHNPYKVYLIRYADDFVITCSDKDFLVQVIKPKIVEFLGNRGLELSEHKTHITHINQGFDFLGQNIRKYDDKLIIKPSKKSVEVFLDKIKVAIKERATVKTEFLIRRLNAMIKGWAMYHRHVCSYETFSNVDFHIHNKVWKWACRRHPDKSSKWVKNKYFAKLKGRSWNLFAKGSNENSYWLMKATDIEIQRYSKIKVECNPYDKDDEIYFEKRKDAHMFNKLEGKFMLRRLYNRQKGICPVCNNKITTNTIWNTHHIHPKHKGGNWEFDNLVMLHPICHRQVHYYPSVAAALSLNAIAL